MFTLNQNNRLLSIRSPVPGVRKTWRRPSGSPNPHLSPFRRPCPLWKIVSLLETHSTSEPYRVFRRLHLEGGWGPWDEQAIFHQRSASERFGWFSSTATSTTRSGPRFARSPRRSDVRLSLCGGGLSKRNGTWESVRAWRRTNGNG